MLTENDFLGYIAYCAAKDKIINEAVAAVCSGQTEFSIENDSGFEFSEDEILNEVMKRL